MAGKLVTELCPVGKFWKAEPEHQGHLEPKPNGYTCHSSAPTEATAACAVGMSSDSYAHDRRDGLRLTLAILRAEEAIDPERSPPPKRRSSAGRGLHDWALLQVPGGRR